MCEKLADGDALFALLCEIRPVRAHALFVVEPSARVRDGERHRSQPFGRRVHDHHRAPFPRVSSLFVADASPNVDGLLSAMVGTAGTTKFGAAGKVFGR